MDRLELWLLRMVDIIQFVVGFFCCCCWVFGAGWFGFGGWVGWLWGCFCCYGELIWLSKGHVSKNTGTSFVNPHL